MSLRRQLVPLYQAAQRRLHPLTYLFLEITGRCNLACLHCGSDCLVTGHQLSLAAADRVLTEIASAWDASKITVVLTGGEPLVHPQVLEIGARAHSLGFRWGMVSNGWAWTPEKVEAARVAGIRALTISLDGLEASHDRLRGRAGSWRRAVAALEMAHAACIPDVVTCVYPDNLEELEQVRALLARLRVPRWRLFNIDPIGRGAQPGLQLDTPQTLRLLEQVATWREDGTLPRPETGCGPYLGAWEGRTRDRDYFCLAGIQVGGVMADGGIGACPNIDRSFLQGSIHTDSFVEVWESRYQRFRDRRWMRTGDCADCAHWRRCHGGDMHLRDPETGHTLLCTVKEHGLD